MRSNIITAAFHAQNKVTTAPAYRGDRGMILRITGVELPRVYELQFSHAKGRPSQTVLGGAGGAAIPDQLFRDAQQIYAWVYLRQSEGCGFTALEIEIPLLERSDIVEEIPTDEQKSAIEQAILALNGAEEQTALDAAAAASSAAEALQAQSAAASSAALAQQAADGVSDDAQSAAESREEAASSAEAAQSAALSAYASRRAAEDAQDKAETAAESLSESAAQIAANTADIAELKKCGVSPSLALLNKVLVPDFTSVTSDHRTYKKISNQIFIRRTSGSGHGNIIALSGDQYRIVRSDTIAAFIPNGGNLVPIGKLNPVLFSVRNKPIQSDYACSIVIVYCSVDAQQTVTVVGRQQSDLDDAVDKIVPIVPSVPAGATHFALVQYARQPQGFDEDSDTVITLDYAPEYLFDQLAALRALALENA